MTFKKAFDTRAAASLIASNPPLSTGNYTGYLQLHRIDELIYNENELPALYMSEDGIRDARNRKFVLDTDGADLALLFLCKEEGIVPHLFQRPE